MDSGLRSSTGRAAPWPIGAQIDVTDVRQILEQGVVVHMVDDANNFRPCCMMQEGCSLIAASKYSLYGLCLCVRSSYGGYWSAQMV